MLRKRTTICIADARCACVSFVTRMHVECDHFVRAGMGGVSQDANGKRVKRRYFDNVVFPADYRYML